MPASVSGQRKLHNALASASGGVTEVVPAAGCLCSMAANAIVCWNLECLPPIRKRSKRGQVGSKAKKINKTKQQNSAEQSKQ